MSNVFDAMRKFDAESERAGQQLAFQERIVKQLLKRANFQLQVGATKREAAEQRGSDCLGFDWLADTFPRFPLRMMSQKMKYTQKATLGDIYGKGRFKKLPWWLEYQQQVDIYNVDIRTQRAALVFNLPYAQDAFLMVLHNQPLQAELIRDAELRQDEPWPRTTFPIGNTGVVAVLEAFDSFLQTVGIDWIDQ